MMITPHEIQHHVHLAEKPVVHMNDHEVMVSWCLAHVHHSLIKSTQTVWLKYAWEIHHGVLDQGILREADIVTSLPSIAHMKVWLVEEHQQKGRFVLESLLPPSPFADRDVAITQFHFLVVGQHFTGSFIIPSTNLDDAVVRLLTEIPVGTGKFRYTGYAISPMHYDVICTSVTQELIAPNHAVTPVASER